MTTITLEEARLIINRWAESSALLLVATSELPVNLIGRFLVVETTGDRLLFRSLRGDVQFSLDLFAFELTCSYSEPREYSGAPEYEAWIATQPDPDKLTSCLRFSFSGLLTGPLEEILVPMGKVVLIELAR
jgi:hypothetical protein